MIPQIVPEEFGGQGWRGWVMHVAISGLFLTTNKLVPSFLSRTHFPQSLGRRRHCLLVFFSSDAEGCSWSK